jgi:integrase
MSIFKRGKVYWYHFLFNGEHIQKSTKQGNPRTARQIEAAYKTALAKGEVGITERKKAPAFKKAMSDFLAWSLSEHQEHPATHTRYKVSAVALRKHFADVQLDRITPEEVERFKTLRAGQVSPRTKRKVKPATVNRELACLKAMFNHVLKTDVALPNPVSRVKYFEEHNEQTRVLSYAEQETYLAVSTPVLRDVAILMLESGMRPEEVYRISPENVHISQGYLVNPYGKTKAAKRRIPLTLAAKAVLRRRIDTKEAYLFPCETDATRPIPKVNNAHDRAVLESKLKPFRLYDLRHTWATRAAMSGIDLVTLAAMLGHSRIQMVLRYAHPTQEHQHQAMERLEQFVATQRAKSRKKTSRTNPSKKQTARRAA